MYPTVSNLYNVHLNNREINEYEEAVGQVSSETRRQLLEQAQAYNMYINESAKLDELGLSYDDLLNIYGNGVMGYVEIPKIDVSIVIYHHTEDDSLQTGLGHLDTTSLPVGGTSSHCVIAGHRGLPSAKLLTDLDQMEIGDVFYIHVLGETLKYSVDNISVVEPEEVSKLNIIEGEDYVTLVTCTPYGINSHRLLVRGTRVYDDDGGKIDIAVTSNGLGDINPVYVVPIAMVVLVLLVFAALKIRKAILKRKDRSNNENREDNGYNNRR